MRKPNKTAKEVLVNVNDMLSIMNKAYMIRRLMPRYSPVAMYAKDIERMILCFLPNHMKETYDLIFHDRKGGVL